MPAETPVTKPPLIVAWVLLIVHDPPVVPSVRVTVFPVHIVALAGEIGVVDVLTVTVAVAAHSGVDP